MNNIIDNFDQILDFAKNYGIPLDKKRGILREYLQVKILELIYRERISVNLFFIGGTSLRLLHGIDRFSEDLDFDIQKIALTQIDKLVSNVYRKLIKENIELDFYRNITAKRKYYEFRFKNLLQPLKISTNHQEKLMIKLDFATFWQGQTRQITLFKKYGFLVNIISVPLEQILVQKAYAYLHRRQTLPRDIYDLVWLYSQEINPDREFLRKNKLPENLMIQVKEKYQREKKKIPNFKIKLRPFLLHEESQRYLDLLGDLVKTIL